MPESLMLILLSELSKIRVRCMAPTCGAVTEFDLARFGQRFMGMQCPVCNAHFVISPQAGSSIAALAQAIVDAQAGKGQFQIEFVLPGKP